MPNDPKSLTLKSLKADNDQLRADVAELRAMVTALQDKLGLVDRRVSTMEVAAPPELRRLDADTVRRSVTADPYATFEVLADWTKAPGSQFTRGARIRADHVPHLVDYVRNGLLVGIPDDQEEVIARMKAQSAERARAAAHEVGLARAAASRAEAELRASRAAAVAYGDGGDGEEIELPPMEGVG